MHRSVSDWAPACTPLGRLSLSRSVAGRAQNSAVEESAFNSDSRRPEGPAVRGPLAPDELESRALRLRTPFPLSPASRGSPTGTSVTLPTRDPLLPTQSRQDVWRAEQHLQLVEVAGRCVNRIGLFKTLISASHRTPVAVDAARSFAWTGAYRVRSAAEADGNRTRTGSGGAAGRVRWPPGRAGSAGAEPNCEWEAEGTL